MTPARIVGIVLILVGIVAVATGGSFSFTKERHTAELGPLKVSVDEKETVAVPVWAGIIAIVAGAGLMLVPAKRG
jgi:hypothetical protein